MARRRRERLGNPRRYTFKLYPTAEQAAILAHQCYMVGDLWNALLEMQEAQYRRTRGQHGVTHAAGKSHLSEFDMGYEISQLREACPEWRELSTWTPRRVATALDAAFQSFFKRARSGAGAQSGYPKYRPRRKQVWLPHRFLSGCKLAHVSGLTWRLVLKGVPGQIHARGKLPAEPTEWTDADIRYRDDTWWLSVACDIESRAVPQGQRKPVGIELTCIDCFAKVDGRPVYSFEVGLRDDARIAGIQRRMSELGRNSDEYRVLRRKLSRLSAKQARCRREALHEWTTEIVRRASDLHLTIPEAIKDSTMSGRGNEKDWGGAVREKAEFNRHVLGQAPSMAIQMIRYKAAEAGVPITETQRPLLEGGNLMVANRKAARILKRALKEVMT